jgi:hypothetical protein
MIVLSDTAFHAAEGDPANLKLCQRGEWEDRMLVETVLSMLTLVCHFKRTIRPKARIALPLNVVMMLWWALGVHHRNA